MNNKPLVIILLLLFLLSCKQEQAKQKKPIVVDTITAQTKAAVLDIKSPTPSLSRLDSIERTNNKSVLESGDQVTKAYVHLNDGGDSIIRLNANIRIDHRIFGYAQPDTQSKRLFLFSIFTDDVENNPFDLPLGAYYETSAMEAKKLKYINTTGNFVKAMFIDANNNPGRTLYFEKKWIEIE
ncbi:hypothetical protein LZQ00_09970 [Sphingobacterium sp. SRCM116780]|uniref:hypothetical protein n=1 Tax=Sphingobacterium sp. SRCM116780 TaxID=2907623 RepID=UPI001F401885|nr:hypothetical protein [Sphingobacterium sp. SRCM116780]UIR54600.1 hypothetical protein LZQ00_09970 [Sphingobacterium sp. SRCM116780]